MAEQQKLLHVVAAVVHDSDNRVLVTQRPEGKHCAGLWEFPGGKVHSGETALQALSRELNEELGISPKYQNRLVKVVHHYDDSQSVLLDVWQVWDYEGDVFAREGQGLQWCSKDQLEHLAMPAADIPVLKALNLPKAYMITSEPVTDVTSYVEKLAFIVDKIGVELLQFRAKNLTQGDYERYARAVIEMAKQRKLRVLLNADIEHAQLLGADGAHLTEQRLAALLQRCWQNDFMVAASCHDILSLKKAESLDLDFAVLSPIKKTRSHPDAKPLGWEHFSTLVGQVNLPVYALGGMGLDDMDKALGYGAQGVAGIGLFSDANSGS